MVSHHTVDFRNLLSTADQLEISGVFIDFFAPDSLFPGVRAAPKSIFIESVSSKSLSDNFSIASSAAIDAKTVNLQSQSATAFAESSESSGRTACPDSGVMTVLIIASILCCAYFIYYNIKSK